ncbi:MAG TPA: glycerol dehydrogenase [Syntrophorhabdales bacterium]|nr:glycerol dehydrogenase [Syntrophorhabdales bacterium]
MALKVLRSPLRYVQGPGALLEMGEQLEMLGIKNPLILASPSARKIVEPVLAKPLREKKIRYALTQFNGQCNFAEIERVKNACVAGGHDAIMNCGGGKTIDTGRAAATGPATNVQKVPPEFIPRFGAGVACINVPTVAATDGSTSASALVYSDKGTVEALLKFPVNPTMVFVDTAVIAKSPIRLFVAGMGDALNTHFEADMNYRTASPSIGTRALSTITGRALAKLCLDILLEFGLQAKKEVETGIPGPGVEAVVEATVLLSGLGFENCGLSAAHAVAHGFDHIPESFERHPFHGEQSGFGTLVQLMLEGRSPQFLENIFEFCRSVGLPTTFEELGLSDASDEALAKVADAASKSLLIQSMAGARRERDKDGRFYDDREIFNALKATDTFGRAFAVRN